MNAFETTTTVLAAGEIRLAGVPLSAGTEVEVFVSPKRKPAEEFREKWERFCKELRCLPQLQQFDEAAIDSEVVAHRAGR
jgi:hypothetical protein